jgi:SsrA-binding protein
MNNSARRRAASDSSITQNKKAFHDYFIEQHFEAGLVLEGWEVKSLRAGRVQLRDAYVLLKNGEALLFGALISPLPSASTHVEADPQRTRKLLLHKLEIDRLVGAIERKGYTAVALGLHWKKGRAKCEIGLAKGKKQHDKRDSEKQRDWERDRQRLLRGR